MIDRRDRGLTDLHQFEEIPPNLGQLHGLIQVYAILYQILSYSDFEIEQFRWYEAETYTSEEATDT